MKILHICMKQYSDGFSYQENLLAKYHRVLGHEVTVLTSMYCFHEGDLVKDDKTEFVDCNGVRVVRLATKSEGIFHRVPTYVGFAKALETIAPDLIFSHNTQYRDLVAVRAYMKAHPAARLLADNHSDYSNAAQNFASKWVMHKLIWRHYTKLIAPYVTRFYGVLPARVDFLADLYHIPRERISLLVMGADDERVQQADDKAQTEKTRAAYGIEKDDFLLVTGGKIDGVKTQTLLLMDAVNAARDTQLKLLIFGSVDAALRAEFDKRLSPRVQYIGWVSSDDSYRYFAMADLVVFPGRHSVFWEQAAGQGKPLLVKDWEGTHHVDVGGNVLFTSSDSAKTLCAAIAAARENCAEMEEVARTRAMPYFSYLDLARRTIKDAQMGDLTEER